MKKLFLLSIIVLLTLFIPTLNAQVQLGLQAGTNLGDVSLDPTPEGATTGMRAGVMFGGVLYYSFSPILGLQVEPAYVQKGATVDISLVEQGMTIKEEATLSGDYFDIPVLLKASFGDGPLKPYLLAGASVAFLLGDVKLEIDKATIDGVDVTNLIPSDEREQLLETKSTDFILNFGGGVLIPAGKVNIFIEGQYNLGLTDLNDEPNDDMKIKSTGIQIKAGVLFPL
jgi:hypothetical protein